jgi:hypothetical protein
MLRTAYELCSICFVICCDNNLLQTCTTYHKLKQEDMKQALGILCFLRRCGISHIWISMSTALAKKILYLSSQVTDNKFSSKRRRLLTLVLNLLIVESHSQTLKKLGRLFHQFLAVPCVMLKQVNRLQLLYAWHAWHSMANIVSRQSQKLKRCSPKQVLVLNEALLRYTLCDGWCIV